MQATKHPLVSKVSDLQASSWDAEFVVIKYCTIVHRLLCISQMETVPVTRFVARIKQRRTFFLSFFIMTYKWWMIISICFMANCLFLGIWFSIFNRLPFILWVCADFVFCVPSPTCFLKGNDTCFTVIYIKWKQTCQYDRELLKHSVTATYHGP